MDRKPMSEAKKKANAKWNSNNAGKYDRVQLVIPAGRLALLKEVAALRTTKKPVSVGGYIQKLICDDLGITDAQWRDGSEISLSDTHMQVYSDAHAQDSSVDQIKIQENNRIHDLEANLCAAMSGARVEVHMIPNHREHPFTCLNTGNDGGETK